jgi:hypothetical protein
LSLPLIVNEPLADLHLNDSQRAIIQRSAFIEETVLETPLPPGAILFATVLAAGLLGRRYGRRIKAAA